MTAQRAERTRRFVEHDGHERCFEFIAQGHERAKPNPSNEGLHGGHVVCREVARDVQRRIGRLGTHAPFFASPRLGASVANGRAVAPKPSACRGRPIVRSAMTDFPRSITAVNHVAPAPRRVRGVAGGEVVFDTTRALYVWEWPHYPQ